MATIYVIDDRATNRSVLSKLASAAASDAQVSTFADPRDAIEQSSIEAPDLVVTDFKMPGMDGAEFTRQFRSLPLCYDVPVIVVTIYEDRSFRYRALEAGATDFLISPLDHQEFQARVRNFLRLRRQQKLVQQRTHALERRLAADTRLHRAELDETKELLRQVIDAVPAAISVTDREGRYLFANSFMAGRRGVGADDIVGKKPEDVFEDWDARRHAKLDERLLESDEPLSTFEEEVVEPDGGRRTFLTAKSMLRDVRNDPSAVVTVSLDVTDRKRVERLAAQQQNHLRAVLDNIPDYICANDEQGHFTLANLAFARAYGTTPDAMIGHTLADFTPDASLAEADAAHNADVLASGRPVVEPEHLVTESNGTERWMRTVKVPFVCATGDIEVLSVSADVSARREAEGALRRAKEEAEAASRMQTEFLATMSHELRTPLNHIIGFAEMIGGSIFGPLGDPRYIEYAGNIRQSGADLLAMIGEILDISMIESGRMRVDEADVDINDVLAEVADPLGAAAGVGDLSIDMDLSPGLGLVRADPKLLNTLIGHLLSNAIKFTAPGGRVTLSSRVLDDGGLAIAVADTGIDSHDFDKVMAPFGQIESIMSRTHHGLGLGLPLAKGMAELHDASLDIASKPGEGTVVTVTLPPDRAVRDAADVA